ncbi:arabinan endo-1,5-alpha-L-arabinosidase [Pseudochryseolinea flava]|uniref:Arabinan endo-1,5-alpha-L-arabinosidase n=1 Tax=Pseudochryseolinea flava TaxID=2059302 RepID=A0A364XUU7_9BACT|nr:arabinan endo-1,5-alpha-L-arabinosidase [Pseudochryseolinea flava]RAV97922.1 arabinan endo-1,5-alpha-L-arabinosidase [Pseudochryseolinea flava]
MRLKHLFNFSIGLTSVLLAACNTDDLQPTGIVTKPKTPSTEFTPPTYADDYASIASWGNRTSWNLANVHDPSVVYDGEYYYMYGTDASYGNEHVGHGHFHGRRSKDLVNWTYIGASMPATPTWVKDTLNNIRERAGLTPIDAPTFGHWAPVVRKVGDKYRMYYSIIVDNYIESGKTNTPANFDGSWTERAFIGLMETTSLKDNTWTDRGMVVSSATDRGTNWSRANLDDWSAYFKWNAIDPSYVVTPENEHWLVYGSWHSGIVALEINPTTGKPDKLETLTDHGVRIARRQNSDANRWQAQEGPEIIYNETTGFYYLFLAYDELSVAYNTRVCRSTNITGPWVGIDGKDITQGGDCWPMLTHPYKFNNHSGWVGISHCAVLQDEASGEWYYASQGRLPENTGGNTFSNAIMMGHIRHIRWTDDGWPVVMPERYAAVPQTAIVKNDLVGTWENITMEYQYKTLQTSTTLTLGADGKTTGAFTADWTYDETKKVLTIGDLKLCVERGLDWEASPRNITLIYSGLTANGRPVWGKKK